MGAVGAENRQRYKVHCEHEVAVHMDLWHMYYLTRRKNERSTPTSTPTHSPSSTGTGPLPQVNRQAPSPARSGGSASSAVRRTYHVRPRVVRVPGFKETRGSSTKGVKSSLPKGGFFGGAP